MSFHEAIEQYLNSLSVAAAGFDQILATIEEARKEPGANQDKLNELQKQVAKNLKQIAFERKWVRERFL